MTTGTTNPVVPSADWQRLCSRVKPGTALVIGRPGSGKTWLVRYLAEQLAAQSQHVGILSTDMGQASVGIPTCLALSLAAPWQDPAASWFIGDTTPMGNLLPSVVGTMRLAEHARAHQVQTLLVDTTGLVDGPLGRVLKYHKALAIGADQVVAIQRGSDLEPLLVLLQGVCKDIHRLSPAAQAQDRTPSERKQHREARFQAHFHGGAILEFEAGRLLGLDWAPGLSSGRAAVIPGTVVGLLDSQGFCLGLGLLEEVRPDCLLVFTRWRERNAVSWLQVGKVRLSRSGKELSG